MKYFKCNAFPISEKISPKVALYPREGNSFPKYLKYEVFFFLGEDFPRSADYLTSRPSRREFFFKIFKMRSVCLF